MQLKHCFKCGTDKPLEMFYRHSEMDDGYLGKCKDCTKTDVRRNRVANIEYYRAYDRKRGSRRSADNTRLYRINNPDKYLAHIAVSAAVRNGRLVKTSCVICGRVDVHGHHDDYSHPLDVIWLCPPHHFARHKILEKKAMAHPKKGYWFAGGRLPGTTTVIGRFKDSGGLLHWAFKQGQNGASHLYEKANEAADIGTCTHSMIEAHINGDDPITVLVEMSSNEEDAEKSRNAYDMYIKWENQTKIKFLTKYQEIQLVSPEYKFGGTPDAVGEIDGEIMLIDWKTSNGVYQDYIIQLAAYCHLINDGVRMDTGEPLPFKVVDGAHLCRFPKEFADFDHRYFGGLADAWQQFKLFREAYTIDKTLKKRAA